MPDVIHNYLSDERNIDLYDENQLTDISDGTNLLYSKLVEYNEQHPDSLSMPYAIWEITDNDNNTLDPNNSKHSELDDKLPYYKGNNRYCSVTFVNPSLDKAFTEGLITEDEYLAHCPSFYAENVDINVQGTSSQAYPRRNFKTKFKKAGNDRTWWYTHPKLNNRTLKKWNMDNADCATNKFTWKIDYMESSGTYNTGFANLVGSGVYAKHPLQYYFDEITGQQYSNYRTSVYGFPCLVFHKHSTPEDLTRPDDQQYLNYEYIGRYNFNLDKSSNEYYGFEIEEEQPYINAPWVEKIKNENKEVIDTINHDHPWFSQIAECWELRDNQGSWTSFKYPNPEARQTGFATLAEDDTGVLEVKKHFEPRYHKDSDNLEIAMDLAEPELGKTYDVDINDQTNKNDYILERLVNLEALFNWLDSTDPINASGTDLLESQYLNTQITKYYSIDSFVKINNAGQYIYNADGELENEKWFVDQEGNKLMKVPLNKDAFPAGAIGKDNGPDPNYCIINESDSSEIYVFEDYENGGCWLKDYNPNSENNNYIGLVQSYSGISYTYTKDTSDYRLAKFKKEFTEHLNKDYCLIYYILTELLLCYDSRGKNMMLATWGPTSDSSGNYVWFPIFYDIDTQLGLNNIGAVLWDYDTDATKDGTFSTANSVLWTNFQSVFQTDIESTYRSLRKSQILNEEKIEGAYLCDPVVFNSYAMQGKRPIIALGLDEWYKYIAPGIPWANWTKGTNRRYGYYVQSYQGGREKTTDDQYVYTCQGDRKLSRELFIRNRLNYLDSQWLAGDNYDPTSSGYKSNIMIRANANDSNTSDKYVQRSLTSNEINTGYIQVSDIVPHYDAVPEFEITPFLSEYVTVFYDEDPVRPPKKYNKINSVITNSTSSVKKGYKESVPYNEQLTYIPGGDYLSDLGDLSLKYPSHFKLTTGKRLTQLILGSDYPNYKNGLLGKGIGTFDLNSGENSQNAKTLLQKIVLTGLTELNASQDIIKCTKLREYRILNTKIPMTIFAEGSPLETIHLPKTTNSLKLVNTKSLNNIITSYPVIIQAVEEDGQINYIEQPYNSYKGLYIEGITDLDLNHLELGNKNFTILDLKDVNLGYGSWTILNNMLTLWETDDSLAKRKLQINLENIYWSPYKLVESNSIYDTTKSELYYYLTNHNTFKKYIYNEENWDLDLLNKKIYLYQSELEESANTLTTLNFLDNFINSYENAKRQGLKTLNYYCSTDDTLAEDFSYPTVTGTIFINNSIDNPINELELEHYKQYFPYLTIIVKNIVEANVLTFVQKNINGSDEKIDQIRFSKDPGTLITLTTAKPSKLNYTFEGWSLNPEEDNIENLISFYDEEAGIYKIKSGVSLFTEEVSEVTLYAYFSIQKYNINFYAGDTLIESYPIAYGQVLGSVLTTEYNPFSDTEEEINLLDLINLKADYRDSSSCSLNEKYNLIGWSRTNHYTVTDQDTPEDFIIKNLSTITIEKEEHFFASYSLQNVHENKTNNKFFNITNGTIAPNDLVAKYLKGKVTIPKIDNNEIIITLQDFNKAENITHIFFENECKNKIIIDDTCFGSDKNSNNIQLQYFEVIDTLSEIKQYAFRYCKNLVPLNFSKKTQNLILGTQCFQNIGANYTSAELIQNSALAENFESNNNLYIEIIPNCITASAGSFRNMGYYKRNIILQLGTPTNRITEAFFKGVEGANIEDFLAQNSNNNKEWNSVIIYPSSSYTTALTDFYNAVSSSNRTYYTGKIQEE